MAIFSSAPSEITSLSNVGGHRILSDGLCILSSVTPQAGTTSVDHDARQKSKERSRGESDPPSVAIRAYGLTLLLKALGVNPTMARKARSMARISQKPTMPATSLTV